LLFYSNPNTLWYISRFILVEFILNNLIHLDRAIDAKVNVSCNEKLYCYVVIYIL
jgi:hypothetical protein